MCVAGFVCWLRKHIVLVSIAAEEGLGWYNFLSLLQSDNVYRFLKKEIKLFQSYTQTSSLFQWYRKILRIRAIAAHFWSVKVLGTISQDSAASYASQPSPIDADCWCRTSSLWTKHFRSNVFSCMQHFKWQTNNYSIGAVYFNLLLLGLWSSKQYYSSNNDLGIIKQIN